MPTQPEQCANYALNQSMCPCTNTGCGNHGICCECLRAHVGYGVATACMKGTTRPLLVFVDAPKERCEVNGSRNSSWCPCRNTGCTNHGVCCNCVRNHWTEDGTGRVACMKAL